MNKEEFENGWNYNDIEIVRINLSFVKRWYEK